uniref:Uncharacterized protein n=1 Tax=Anas platyrhynchos platyrhynchos TaxID=8840 RepID=A0A493SZQ4_ANAPP
MIVPIFLLYLLEFGQYIEDHNENGHTPLMEAGSAGHVEVARVLLENGAGINTHSNEFKESALTLACYKGIVPRLLLDSGAQVNMPADSFESPLTLAACGGHVELAALLIERGANLEEVNDEGYTPLMEAAREVQVVFLLFLEAHMLRVKFYLTRLRC